MSQIEQSATAHARQPARQRICQSPCAHVQPGATGDRHAQHHRDATDSEPAHAYPHQQDGRAQPAGLFQQARQRHQAESGRPDQRAQRGRPHCPDPLDQPPASHGHRGQGACHLVGVEHCGLAHAHAEHLAAEWLQHDLLEKEKKHGGEDEGKEQTRLPGTNQHCHGLPQADHLFARARHGVRFFHAPDGDDVEDDEDARADQE